MSGPALGIGRITVPYTVSSLTHMCRMYVYNPVLSGANWVIDNRPSVGGQVVWSTAAEHLSQTISYILATGTTPGTAFLEELSSTGWLPRATAAVTMPNLSGSPAAASQVTTTLRDSNFTRPKIVVMECNNPGPLKFTSPTAGGANFDSYLAEFLSTGLLSARPFVVMVNQHEFFLQDAPFVSTTITYNRKLRRARGLG